MGTEKNMNDKYELLQLLQLLEQIKNDGEGYINIPKALYSLALAIKDLEDSVLRNYILMTGSKYNEADFKDLGPVDEKNPNIHSFIYKPENYPWPIAMDATLKTSEDYNEIK
jgi:hypothetical protein